MVQGRPRALRGYKAGFVAQWVLPVVSHRGECSSLPISCPILEKIPNHHACPSWDWRLSVKNGDCRLSCEGLTRCLFLRRSRADCLLLLLGADGDLLSSFGGTRGPRPQVPFPLLSSCPRRQRTLQKMGPDFRHRRNKEMGAGEQQ